MAGARTFVVRFLADADQYKKGIKQVNDGMGGLKTQVSSLLPSFKTVAISGAAAFGSLAAGIGFAMKAAAEDQKSQAELQRQLERTFGANQALVRSTEDYIGATELRYGTSDTALRSSLGLLVRSTGDMTQAQDLLNTAQNISASTGKDLESVSLALARASQGQFTALSKLGVPLDDATKKSKDFGAVMTTLNDQFGGAAQAQANTFSGQMARLGTVFENVKEKVGFAILNNAYFKDAIDRLPGAVDKAITALGERGIIAALKTFVSEMGIVGAYVNRFTISFAISWNELLNDIFNGLRLLTLGLIQLVPGFAAAGKEIDSRLLNLGLKYQANSMYIQDFKDSSAEATKEMKRNGAASDRLSQQASGLGKSLGLGDDAPGGGSGVAKAVKTATEKLKVYTDALKSSNSAQKSFTAAQKASVKAGQSLTTANQGVADAQAALDQAVAGYGANSPQAKKAAFELAQAQRGLERAGYNVEGSLFAIANAEAELKKVRADPESTPQAIREAEIALAEAKLSSADAIDQQTEATNGLKTATNLLNDAVNGASAGSEIFKTLSDALTDAKEKQSAATEAVAEAIDRETEALDNYREAIKKVGETQLLYPKVIAANPMAGVAAAIPSTVTGNSTGFNPNGSAMVINNTVQAGIVASPDEIAQELANLSDRYRRLNGGAGFF
jgi:hypothetical protein